MEARPLQFESPWLLLGLGAAAIPIIIHLINRRRAPVVLFAAIDFILRSDKRLARKLKLRQLLALLLRVSLMMAIPFALARPYCMPPDAPSSSEQTPTSVVFVVDNSLSMAATPGAESRLALAKRRVRDIAERLGGQSNVALVTASFPARAATTELSFDRGRFLDALDAVPQSFATSDIGGGLRVAEALVASSTLPEQRVIVLSDMQATSFEGLDNPWSLEKPPPVEVVDVAQDDAPLGLNAAVLSVVVAPAHGHSAEHVQVDATIGAFGEGEFSGTATLELGERVVQNSVQVKAGETVTTSFVVKTDSGSDAAGRVKLDPDPLAQDDERAFAANLFSAVQVLLVNGAPRTTPYKDELFFVERALRPAAEGGASRFRVTSVKTDELDSKLLERTDVVVLANAVALPAPAVTALDAFVRGGGGLLIAAGDNVTSDYNRAFGELLPIPVRDVKSVVSRDDKDAAVKALVVEQVEQEHPVFRGFANLRDASLYRARFYTYLLLDAAAAPADSKVLAALRNGAPLLVERPLGQGRTAIFTATLDRDWSDLPIRSSFLPLMQELVLYLGGRLDGDGPQSVRVGEPLSIPVAAGEGRIAVERPDGKSQEVEPTGAGTGGALRYENTDIPGIYVITRQGQDGTNAKRELSAVSPDPRESDVRSVDVAAAEASLRKTGEGGAERPAVRLSRTDERRTNVWPYVLAGLFALLLSEALVVFRS
jgi:hypothetical protein